MNAIDRFVTDLSAATMPPGLFNLYAQDGGPSAACCRHNLRLYLRDMQQRDPAWLLIGEAPGYRGCRQTGIPFTSEAVVWPPHDGLDVCELWRDSTSKWRRRSRYGTPQREATATTVWRTLSALALLPVMWNALPFHPHREGVMDSNRTPSLKEVDRGRTFLLSLMALFPNARPIAVGRKAGQALARWGLDAPQIRHPSHGGARRFREELEQLTG